jgi:hypothetical protein
MREKDRAYFIGRIVDAIAQRPLELTDAWVRLLNKIQKELENWTDSELIVEGMRSLPIDGRSR